MEISVADLNGGDSIKRNLIAIDTENFKILKTTPTVECSLVEPPLGNIKALHAQAPGVKEPLFILFVEL